MRPRPKAGGDRQAPLEKIAQTDRLSAQGLGATHTNRHPNANSPWTIGAGKRVGVRHVLAMTEQLLTLLDAGLPLDRALHISQGSIEHPLFPFGDAECSRRCRKREYAGRFVYAPSKCFPTFVRQYGASWRRRRCVARSDATSGGILYAQYGISFISCNVFNLSSIIIRFWCECLAGTDRFCSSKIWTNF